MTATERIQQKIKDGTLCLSHDQDHLTAVHEAGHVVSYWAISRKIIRKRQRYWERLMRERPGNIIPRRLPDLPPKFRVVLRTADEAKAGPYHHSSGSKCYCHGIVDMEEMDLDTRLQLSAGEHVKFNSVTCLTGPIAEIYAASFDKYHRDDRLSAQADYEQEYVRAWELVCRLYGSKRIGRGQLEKLTTEAHDLVFNHWAAIEALAVKLVEKRVIKSDEAIAIIEEASTKDNKEHERR